MHNIYARDRQLIFLATLVIHEVFGALKFLNVRIQCSNKVKAK